MSPIDLTASLWNVGGHRSTQRDFTQSQGAHANFTQKVPDFIAQESNPGLLVLRHVKCNMQPGNQ